MFSEMLTYIRGYETLKNLEVFYDLETGQIILERYQGISEEMKEKIEIEIYGVHVSALSMKSTHRKDQYLENVGCSIARVLSWHQRQGTLKVRRDMSVLIYSRWDKITTDLDSKEYA